MIAHPQFYCRECGSMWDEERPCSCKSEGYDEGYAAGFADACRRWEKLGHA